MLTTLVLVLSIVPFWLLVAVAFSICVLAGWTVWRFKKKTIALGFACLWMLCSLGLFGYLVVRYYTPYSPSGGVRLGAEAYWLTQPTNNQEVVRRNIQRDAGLRNCEYNLFGWNANDTFYFQSRCDNQRYFFTPTAMFSAEPISTISEDLMSGVCPHVNLADYFEDEVPRFYSFSNDCRYVAVVTDQLPGPRDILVIGIN